MSRQVLQAVTMTETPHSIYRVVYSQAVVQRLKVLAIRATYIGIGQQFLAALKTILQSLATDPVGWGDPNYRLRSLNLLVCHGILSFLHVRYVVDED